MNYLILAMVSALFSFPQSIPAQKQPESSLPAENRVAYEMLKKIAACESQSRHFDDNGNVLVGANRYDIGKYQINAIYWQSLAEKLGYDIYTEEGNKAMAMELYRRYGTGPWHWSKKCWNK
ncbi:MAG: hypothetical protein Q8Q46_00095 [Candidatus Giovannonibacteria bacterium]|nr:hypothetical protein [Candidatus Giovannonibacteria bacterium]